MAPIPVPGCRHDILGHNLKAIGILRTLATCADSAHRDPDAEGWWDSDAASFQLRSYKYPTEEKLVEFFAEHYRPTSIFSPWNTGGGLDKKLELVLRIDQNKSDGQQKATFGNFLCKNLDQLEAIGDISKKAKEKIQKGKFENEELALTIKSSQAVSDLIVPSGVVKEIRDKTSGKKAVMAVVERKLAKDSEIIAALKAGYGCFAYFHNAKGEEQRKEVLESFRDQLSELGSSAVDAVLTTRVTRSADNPIFLTRGMAGNTELFRSFWNYFLVFKGRAQDLAGASFFPQQASLWDKEKSPGAPFFPDAIKTYNNGLRWEVETFPFNALDYLLAVEGALALRGAVSRTLAANSRRFAAFPFVFDTGEDLVDDDNKVRGTASAVWLPLWDRPTTYVELESFICDAQARLPGKEARFSSEFARALRVQGVDAGFFGWQEFRFKMKGSKVPWVCTGRYLGSISEPHAVQLNDALAPLNDSKFLDQFEPVYAGNKLDTRSPHTIRADLNSAIETAVAEPTPDKMLEILVELYGVCRQMAQSKSFREKLRDEPIFFDGLPCRPWETLLRDLEEIPEFRIARALGSITGLKQQQRRVSGRLVYSDVQPFLGSLLPLKRGSDRWYLPTEPSKQAVWSGADLCSDLTRVLARRYLDSLDDDLPALCSPRPARLEDVLAFLDGDLDDHRIARWTEALSLIRWRWKPEESLVTEHDESPASRDLLADWPAVPPAYAAMRALLELECKRQGNDLLLRQKRRSQRPIALVCQRVPSSIALAVEDSLRWLSIWGVPNCWGQKARREKDMLKGHDVVRLDHRQFDFQHQPALVHRIAAAVVIPVHWQDRWKLFQAVTLPQKTQSTGANS